MPRLFPCKSLPQAQIIRSFLLEHDIEAYVLHENASTLWCGAIAGSVLAIHETDLPFVMDAFATPRMHLTEDSEVSETEFSETAPGPLKCGGDFFWSLMLFGMTFTLGFAALLVGLEIALSLPERFSESDIRSWERRSQVTLADVVFLLGFGALGGLLAGVAILAARKLRPDENGRFSTGARWGLFLLGTVTGYLFPMILVYLGFALTRNRRSPDES